MKTNLIIIFVLSVLLVSCKNKSTQITDNDSGFIEISKAQFESEKMVIGEPILNPFTDEVNFTGSIIPSIDGQAQISLPLPGIIDKIHCKPGQIISKGSIMFEVSGNGFIDQQKDFAESSAIVSRLKSDYLRAKELYEANIASPKDFTYAESNYYAENAKHKALKIKLESMGLDVSKIEKGVFYSSYTIKSSINGFVSSINATIGQYVEPQQKIAEIIDDKSFQLRLSVFEKNIIKIKTGQTVAFYLNGNKSVKHKATINGVGKTIIPDSKSIECFAVIDNPKSINMVGNQFVEGSVYTAVDSVLSVPETAIIYSDNNSYILIYEKEVNSKYYFKKIKVKTGRKVNNYIELTEQLPSSKLLVNGIYNIQIE
ncbi:MAG: efflux RND transporter periplasmic adaptor subunit [Bacteroidetes bacterium]|nr:efflux RND transporter periplasmic adaptor subunit [Bacteroidota bacterium]